jgi:molybdopterin molybdotransferase
MSTLAALKHETPAAALEALLQGLRPVGTETVPLEEAAGRVLAAPLRADRPSPACNVSAMDGYALSLADRHRLLSPEGLPLGAAVRTGSEAVVLPAGHAVKVMTGGMVPEHADAVIPREDVQELPDCIFLRDTATEVRRGQHIRCAGENVSNGEEVLSRGRVITTAVAGALAAFGCARVTVHRKLRVATLITGDEVLLPGASPQPWQLRDSNGPALASLFRTCAFAEHRVSREVRDDRKTLEDALRESLACCDAIICSGGVSVGDFDFVPSVLQGLGADIVFHRLPIRPGKPVLGALGPQGQLILGLPGNPVAVLVTARYFALAALRAQAGVSDPVVKPASVTLANPDDDTLGLWWYRLASLTGPNEGRLVSNRGSGDLVAAARADGFVQIAPRAKGTGPWPFFAWA